MPQSPSELSKLVNQLRRDLAAVKEDLEEVRRKGHVAHQEALRPPIVAAGNHSYDPTASGLAGITVQAAIDEVAGSAITDHGALTGLLDDDHTQYSRADGTRAFTGTVGGVTPLAASDLTTKGYVDALTVPVATWSHQIDAENMRFQDTGSGTLAAATPSIANATNYSQAYSFLSFGGTTQRAVLVEVTIPAELDVDNYSIDADLFYVLNGEVTSGDAIEWETSARAPGDNEAVGSATTATQASVKEVTGYSNDDLVKHEILDVVPRATINNGEVLGIVFFRDATAGNTDDTFASGVRLRRIVLKGTLKSETIV